jgi:hypothetical protein
MLIAQSTLRDDASDFHRHAANQHRSMLRTHVSPWTHRSRFASSRTVIRSDPFDAPVARS